MSLTSSVLVDVPQIAWHAREPIQSVDVSPTTSLIATAGNDNEVRLWRLPRKGDSMLINFVQSLVHHSKTVNVVRFCPLGVTLASAGDDSVIVLWRERARGARGAPAFGEPAAASSQQQQKEWSIVCMLRGHCADVYDLAWSPRADALFSGCVDGTSIVWNVGKGKAQQTLTEHNGGHTGYVQGVAWDPADEFIVSISQDRTAHVYASERAQLPATKKGKKKGAAKDEVADDEATAAVATKGDVASFCPHTILAKRTQSALPAAAAGSAKAPSVAGAKDDGALKASVESASPAADGGTAEDAFYDAAANSSPTAVTAPAPTEATPSCSTTLAPASSAEAAAPTKPTKVKPPKPTDLFCDETGSFYRRLSWSPDGAFLLIPSGQYFEGGVAAAARPTTYVFSRASLALSNSAPCAHLPSPDKAVVAVRCCPVLFEHAADANAVGAAAANGAAANGAPPSNVTSAGAAADTNGADEPGEAHPRRADEPAADTNGGGSSAHVSGDGGAGVGWMRALPYRMLWAVATLDSIVVYDSMAREPVLIASHTHYAPLTDLAWLPDGHGLLASSMDGYCTIVRFKPRALGKPLARDRYPGHMLPKTAPIAKQAAAVAVATPGPAPGPTPAPALGTAGFTALGTAGFTAPAAASTTPLATADAMPAPAVKLEAVKLEAAAATAATDSSAPAPGAGGLVPDGTAAEPAATDVRAREAAADGTEAASAEPPLKKARRVQAIMTHTLDGVDSSSLAPPSLPPAPAASAAAAAEVDEVDESVEPSAGTAEFRQVECATTEAAPPSSDTLAAPVKKPRRIEAVMTHTL